jgi:hypothetical protein
MVHVCVMFSAGAEAVSVPLAIVSAPVIVPPARGT